jgi:hypothetical protein
MKMTQISRILVGLLAAFYLLIGIQYWFMFDQAAATFHLSTTDLFARANIRADMGVTFFGIGILSAMAAWKKGRAYAWGAMLLLSIALVGRIVSMLIDGPAPGGTMPMIVEALSIAILYWGYSSWKAKSDS